MAENIQNEHDIEESLRRVRGGDTDAYEVVIRQLERPLRAWIASLASPGIDVAEIAQQSFITAYLRLQEYEPGTNFSAWLFAIARYQLKTETTRLRRIADYQVRFAPDLLSKELDRQEKEPSSIMATRLEYLRLCTESLGGSLSQFLNWRYQEEVSLEEMAKRSGRSVSAVKKQLWILRQQLKACIEARAATSRSL